MNQVNNKVKPAAFKLKTDVKAGPRPNGRGRDPDLPAQATKFAGN